ncbi:MAG: protein kinase [Gemmatimonadota bacterium]|jgi:serine/threonine-protein kinase
MNESLERLKSALADRYAVERRLGEGGTATVYLAEDLKHDRKVALKVLRPELAAVLGHERFLQEIRTTAGLQHPHILPLFDSGRADGFLYYVMPYVEGETLRDRLDRETQLGVEEAVRITVEVADAVDYAHRHGVIHRDLKPENILLQEGRPVVADFGIALAVSVAAGGRMTETGLSLGTPHYMSPEQATAEKQITHRTDVYSLGCVLYEMLTGDPPHTGSSAQAIILKIVAEEAPPVDRLRKTVPANVVAAVGKALQKLPADRFESAEAFASALRDPRFTTATVAAPGAGVPAADSRWRRRFFAATAAAALLLAATILALLRPGAPGPVSRQRITLWDGDLPSGLMMLQRNAAIVPDGSAIVHRAVVGDQVQLVRKPREEVSAVPIAGTEGAVGPFFSPDGAWLAFFADGSLRKVPAAGGAPLTLADSVRMDNPGGAWLENGTVYFVGFPYDLRRVDADGGDVEVVASLVAQQRGVVTPWPLPEGRGVLFSASTLTATEIDGYVYDPRSDTVRLVVPGGIGLWYAEGRLLYSSWEGGLFAAPFDLERLEVTGPGVPVLDGLLPPELTFSREGTALYVVGEPGSGLVAELVWVDRAGRAEPVQEGWTFRAGDANWGMALSPDGSRIALRIAEDRSLATDIWIKPLPDGPLSRLTFGEGDERMPRWSPDGRFVTFLASGEGRSLDLVRKPSDGAGDGYEVLLDHERPLAQGFYGPAGEWLILRPFGGSGRDILGFRPGRDSVPVPLVATEHEEQAPAVSPDGRWLAYLSDETGRNEVFVRPFPDTEGGKWQVSDGGAYAPLWSQDGTELFYVNTDRQMVALRVDPGPSFAPGERRALFTLPPGCVVSVVQGYYDITPDDQRFLMRRSVEAGAEPEQVDTRQLILVQNWFEELKERVGR